MATTETLRISGRQGIEMKLKLYVLDCASCGVVFGITTEYEARRRGDAQSFMCPNGHHNSWSESAEERERKRRQAEERRAERLSQELAAANTRALREREAREAAERQASALRGVVTKTKRRVGNGVCPCCNRSFTALQQHMATKHPEYVDGGEYSWPAATSTIRRWAKANGYTVADKGALTALVRHAYRLAFDPALQS